MTDEADSTGAGATGAGGDGALTRVAAPRADEQSEWELFLRESPTEPLRHAGSVTAPSAAAARERATGLFPDASTLWCCPASEVARFAVRDLGAEYRDADAGPTDGTPDAGGERP